MTDDKKLKKSIFRNDNRKYYWGQLFFNMGTTAFVAALSVWMFIAFGDGTAPLGQTQGMVFLVVLFSAVIQCWAVTTNTRQDLLRDKWFMKAEPGEGAEARYVPNPWRLILPRALAAAAPVAVVSALIVPCLGHEPFHLVNVGFMIGLPLLALSSILIMIITPRDQEAFAAAMARKSYPAVPHGRYVFMEHMLPWIPIQGIINFGVGIMQFAFESHKAGGMVPVRVAALDAGFVFALITFLSWASSQVQVRPDVRLGRVAPDDRKAPSVPVMLLLLALCNGFGLIAWGVLYVVFGPEVSTLPAACFKAVTVMVAVVPGCMLGVWWGRRRETALINNERDEKGADEVGEAVA